LIDGCQVVAVRLTAQDGDNGRRIQRGTTDVLDDVHVPNGLVFPLMAAQIQLLLAKVQSEP
jgi:hypothetical protein